MVLAALWNWLRGPRPGRTDLHVIMYTRAGCCLCETAWDILREYQDRYGFTLEAVDIADSPELLAQYGQCIPVVTVNGKVRFRGVVNKVLLQRLLDAEPRTSPPSTLLF